jgi:hypothetical protein
MAFIRHIFEKIIILCLGTHLEGSYFLSWNVHTQQVQTYDGRAFNYQIRIKSVQLSGASEGHINLFFFYYLSANLQST